MRKAYKEIISLVIKAAEKAKTIGISNLLQPGLVKEMIIADILDHTLIISKRDADAHAPRNPKIKYEYLSCKEGGSGQLDRMFKSPYEKRTKSIERISRNSKIYLAVFYKENQLKCKIIYELEPKIVAKEANRQLDASQNDISHVGFSVNWAMKHGKAVYRDKELQRAEKTA